MYHHEYDSNTIDNDVAFILIGLDKPIIQYQETSNELAVQTVDRYFSSYDVVNDSNVNAFNNDITNYQNKISRPFTLF